MKPSAVAAQGDGFTIPRWTPADNGFIAATDDPTVVTSSFTMGAGVLYLSLARLAVDSTITSVYISPRTTAGAGLSNAFLGVYSIKGVLLGQTADVSTQMQSAAEFVAALATPITGLQAGTRVFLAALVGAGSTLPTVQSAAGGRRNANLVAASPFAGATYGTSQTALPTPLTIASLASLSNPPFMALV